MTSRSYWTAVWCGFLVLTIGLGVRQSFGIFLKPVSAELHVVIDWIWAHRWRITFALIPLLALTIVFAVRRGRR